MWRARFLWAAASVTLFQQGGAVETLVSAIFYNDTTSSSSSSSSTTSHATLTDTNSRPSTITSAPASTTRPHPNVDIALGTSWITSPLYVPNPYVYPSSFPACSSSWDASYSAWNATGVFSTQTVTSRLTLEYTNSIETFTYNSVFEPATQTFAWTAKEPCCLQCSFNGGDATVYHWPPATPTPSITKLVAPDGFVFEYPSIYVVFNSLSATDLCQTIGTAVTSTTIAFDPASISTAIMTYWNEFIVRETVSSLGPFTHATFTSAIPVDCPVTTSISPCIGDPDSCGAGDQTSIWSSCSPYLSLPTQLYSINPAWSSCNRGIKAFFDPPSVLTAAGTLSAYDPTVHVAIALPTTTSTPQPQPTVVPATPTPTLVTPTPTPTTSVKAQESGGLTPGFLTPVSPPVANTPKASSPVANSPAADPSPSTPSTTLVLAPEAETSPVDPAPAQNPASSPVQAQKPSSVEQPAVVVPQAQSTNNPAVVPAPAQTPQQAASNVAPSVNTSPAVANSPAASKSPVGDSPVANSPAANSPSQAANSPAANSPAANSPAANSPSANLPAAKPPTSAIPILVGTNTIAAGAPAVTISGTTYSVASTGGGLVINNSVTKVVGQAAPTPNSVAAPAPFVAGTQTVTPGSAAVVVAGTTYSIPSSGGAVVINEATSTFAQLAPLVTPATPSYLIASQTLAAGGSAITLSSSTISLQSGGQSVVVAGTSATQTLALSEVFPSAAPITPTYSVASADPTYFYGSQTLAFGGAAITVSSSLLVSLLSGGSSVVVEGSTTTQTLALSDAFVSSEYVLATGTSLGMGGLIESLGGFATPTTSASGAGYTGPMVGGGNGSYSGPWVSHGGKVEVGALAAWSIAMGLTMLGIVLL